MSDQNWRTEVDANDFFGHQKKRVALEQRRPVVRKASDLVGPGIGAEAIRITDYNDILATFNGYYASEPGALNAPGNDSYVGTTVSDPVLGGHQTFVGLSTGYEYTRTFVRNASDASAISWGVWEATERVPASATADKAIPSDDLSGQGSQILRPPRIKTIGAPGTYSRDKESIYVLRPGVYTGYLTIDGPSDVPLDTISVTFPDRDTAKTATFGPIRAGRMLPIPFTFWTTGQSQELRVYVSHDEPTAQTFVWADFNITRVGDVPDSMNYALPGETTPETPSVPGTPPDGATGESIKLKEVKWKEQTVTLTALDIARGYVTVRLDHIPEPESLLAWWHPDGVS